MENKVELIGFYGSDSIIAQSAWTSTNRELTENKLNRVDSLLEMLWTNGHHTPFEKGIVHFLVTSDIASHIHLLKHRISSLNAESARYKELKEDKFYLPEDWNGINFYANSLSLNEQEWAKGIETWKQALEYYTELGNKLYHECLADLTPVLGRKRAKESARYFKTYNSQITCDVMFNMRSFANFYKLRADEHAQVEIQFIAKEMLKLIKEIEGKPFNKTCQLIESQLCL